MNSKKQKLTLTEDQRAAVVNMVQSATGMLENTSDRQRKNGTISFYDHELFETYTIHTTGYSRRKNAWGGIYQLNDKRPVEHSYEYNGVRRTWIGSARILESCPFKLAALVVRGWNARREVVTETITTTRRKRQYVWDIAARRMSR